MEFFSKKSTTLPPIRSTEFMKFEILVRRFPRSVNNRKSRRLFRLHLIASYQTDREWHFMIFTSSLISYERKKAKKSELRHHKIIDKKNSVEETSSSAALNLGVSRSQPAYRARLPTLWCTYALAPRAVVSLFSLFPSSRYERPGAG